VWFIGKGQIMSKFVRSWVVGGALLAAAVAGCRHSQSGCATCGGGGSMATTTTGGSVYPGTATGPVMTPGYNNTTSTSGSSMPMRMPSSSGLQTIDAPGIRQ
jgi:hypothetical protein